MSLAIPFWRSLSLSALLTLAGPPAAAAGEVPNPLTPPEAFTEDSPAEAPFLTGSWVLNEKASDDLLAALQAAVGSKRDRPGGPGDPGGGRGGPGAMGGSGGGRPGGGERGGRSTASGDMNPGLRLKQEISRLEIFQQGTELNITDGLNISRLIVIGGGEASIWTERGEVKARARWEKGKLVEEWRPSGQGAGRTRRYALTEDGRQLIVEEQRTVPGQDRALTFKLVYNRQP